MIYGFFLGFLVNDSVVWMENIHGSEIINQNS